MSSSSGRARSLPADGVVEQRRGGARRVEPDRRAAAGRPPARQPRPQRHRQRRRGVRAARDQGGRRERLRRPRPARPGGGVPAGAVRPSRRPIRHLLPAADRCGRRTRLEPVRRSGPRARGLRRRHSVPADPRGADRADLRHLASSSRGSDRQGRRRDRAARRGTDRAARQDRHADARHACDRARPRPPTASARTRSSVSPPRSTSSPHIPWRRRSSTRRVERGLALDFPADVVEEPGRGIAGIVAGRRVAVGSETWLRPRGHQPDGPSLGHRRVSGPGDGRGRGRRPGRRGDRDGRPPARGAPAT